MWLNERLSRRALLLLPWMARNLFGVETGVRRLLEAHPVRAVTRYHRRYRVNAVILFLGVPIFRREDAGAGCASVETGACGEMTVTALQFAAGSRPERSKGLNRLGLMREAVVEQDAHLRRASYAGFMTSSPEKSLDQGRRSLSAGAAEMPCSLGRGESTAGRTELSVRHFTVPSATRWTDTAGILDSLESSPEPATASGVRGSSRFGPTATFLYAIHRAILEDGSRARRQFCYNGKLHELITEKQSSPAGPVRLSGSIRDQSGAAAAEFVLWIDPADPSGIPSRIEYRARSFLRLVFESEPGGAQAQAAIPWLIGG